MKQQYSYIFQLSKYIFSVFIVISGQLQNLTFIGVMVANTLGIIQEFKVKKTIDKLSVVTVEKVKTLRNGQLIDVPGKKLLWMILFSYRLGIRLAQTARL